jgi:hypothetical protein
MTGSINYRMNTDGEYPVDAPPCHCSLGISEAIQGASPYEEDCEEEDKEFNYLLPCGGHLLPEDFQNLICERNSLIEKITGKCWSDDGAVAEFKRTFPLDYSSYTEEVNRLCKIYPNEVEQLKAYQKANK